MMQISSLKPILTKIYNAITSGTCTNDNNLGKKNAYAIKKKNSQHYAHRFDTKILRKKTL